MATVEINLPDELEKRAREAGLLSDKAVRHMVEDAVRRRAGRALMAAIHDVHSADIPPMSMDEIDAEVKAYRAERRARDAGSP